MRRTRWDARNDKARAIAAAEASGELADSMAVRLEIVRRMQVGELTLEEGQAELKRIQREARKAGKPTRGSVWRQS